ncbi:uncharacterized protein KGF55_000896 [Candida pseudojiufengensis]|uniref:uncharacterized protein n=1 Tax=Candida pseudojiufengensis TaxID=497109 RepID=UPI0022258155|nr:uncharacterized protein KGF55_000896 [Candida pseudojiufengensis]KAI5966586.1 hypothetical protein KGF55_000896 [Candida pseudojiufengensis]
MVFKSIESSIISSVGIKQISKIVDPLKAPVNTKLVYSGSIFDSRWEKIRDIIKQNTDDTPESTVEDLEPEIPYYRVNKFKTIKELRLEVTQASSSDHENLEESSDSLSSELVLNSSEPVVTNLFTINTEEIGRRYQKIKLEREPHDINSYVALHSYYIESLNIQFLPAPNNYILTGACSLIDPRFLHISNMLS